MLEIDKSANEGEKSYVMNWFKASTIAVKSIAEVINAIKEEHILLPLYQRDSVWEEEQICALWDSLLCGFPLPSFFLTEGKGDNSRPLSSGMEKRTLTKEDEGKGYFDLIDGQQRLIAIRRGYVEDPRIRLWIDLAPPKNKAHPFQFNYWIHPCTSTFPFGFRMRAAGEHRFENLSDQEIRSIWSELQKQKVTEGKEFFEIPLINSFPWTANCPVPLYELLALISKSDCTNLIKSEIKILAEQERAKIISLSKMDVVEPDDGVVDLGASALIELSNYKLALQKTETKDDSFTLFERIGRGGVQISQRQLAVSQLMLEMGKEANDAVAQFQNGNWKDLLDTEEIIHAVTRVSYANIQALPEHSNNEDERNSMLKWDLFEFDLTKIKEIKKEKDKWALLITEMQKNCNKLEASFDAVISSVLLRNSSKNNNGFSLVQLAQTAREGGIQPITLHPLLYWALYVRNETQEIDVTLRENMLQWVIFSNGIVNNSAHKKLNQLAFYHIAKNNKLNFSTIKKEIFDSFSDEELTEIGLVWSNPVLDSSKNEVVDRSIKLKDIPKPKDITGRTMRRLFLRNWADGGVNKFILMWNQREMLDKIYGNTKPEHIHALYGKGRPVDVDHIVARDLLTGYRISDADMIIKKAAAEFLSEPYKKAINLVTLNEITLRLNFSNLNGNYRYWPKYLNRSDQNHLVNDKLPKHKILERLDNHPLQEYFTKEDGEIGWKWSIIQHKADWENLPPQPSQSGWTESSIAQFITAIITRENDLYTNVFNFLMHISSQNAVADKIDLQEIIKD